MLPCLTVDLAWGLVTISLWIVIKTERFFWKCIDFREKCLLLVDGVKKGGGRCSFEVRRFSLRFWPCFAGFLGANQGHFILILFKMVPVH